MHHEYTVSLTSGGRMKGGNVTSIEKNSKADSIYLLGGRLTSYKKLWNA